MKRKFTAKPKFSAEYLRSLLRYEPETGKFFWLKVRAGIRPKPNLETGITRLGHYRQIAINGHTYRANRLAWLYMTGEWPEGLVDHIDGDRTNDKFANLRACDHSGNNSNVRMHDRNKVGKKGVIRCKDSYRARPYRAQIVHLGKQHTIGYFATAEEAHAAYAVKAQELKGEFARVE